jgi:hypothetical protein
MFVSCCADHRPKRSIVFCSWDGEEYALLGSTEWVEVIVVMLLLREIHGPFCCHKVAKLKFVIKLEFQLRCSAICSSGDARFAAAIYSVFPKITAQLDF